MSVCVCVCVCGCVCVLRPSHLPVCCFCLEAFSCAPSVGPRQGLDAQLSSHFLDQLLIQQTQLNKYRVLKTHLEQMSKGSNQSTEPHVVERGSAGPEPRKASVHLATAKPSPTTPACARDSACGAHEERCQGERPVVAIQIIFLVVWLQYLPSSHSRS